MISSWRSAAGGLRSARHPLNRPVRQRLPASGATRCRDPAVTLTGGREQPFGSRAPRPPVRRASPASRRKIGVHQRTEVVPVRAQLVILDAQDRTDSASSAVGTDQVAGGELDGSAAAAGCTVTVTWCAWLRPMSLVSKRTSPPSGAPQPAAALPAGSAGTWRTAWESDRSAPPRSAGQRDLGARRGQVGRTAIASWVGSAVQHLPLEIQLRRISMVRGRSRWPSGTPSDLGASRRPVPVRRRGPARLRW